MAKGGIPETPLESKISETLPPGKFLKYPIPL